MWFESIFLNSIAARCLLTDNSKFWFDKSYWLHSVRCSIVGTLLTTTHTISISVVDNSHVSILSPASTPGVSENVVLFAVRGAIANKGNVMVSIGSTGWRIENSTWILSECLWVSFDLDSQDMLGECRFDLVVIFSCHCNHILNFDISMLGLAILAASLNLSVWIIWCKNGVGGL